MGSIILIAVVVCRSLLEKSVRFLPLVVRSGRLSQQLGVEVQHRGVLGLCIRGASQIFAGGFQHVVVEGEDAIVPLDFSEQQRKLLVGGLPLAIVPSGAARLGFDPILNGLETFTHMVGTPEEAKRDSGIAVTGIAQKLVNPGNLAHIDVGPQ